MKVLVVYDSTYGNTEKIAMAIAGASSANSEAVRSDKVNPLELKTLDLLIVGSPTQGGRPTPAIQQFLAKVSDADVKGLGVASFDTRLSTRWVGIFGYAAGKIAENLKAKGASLIVPGEPFFVKGKEGPLKDGELERAASWAKTVLTARSAITLG